MIENESKKEKIENKEIEEKNNKKEGNTEIINKETDAGKIENKNEPEKNTIENKKEIKKNERKPRKNIKVPVIIISALIIILIILSIVFALVNINNEKILGNITIMGIDISNMTKEEAKEEINEIINAKLSEEMTLKKDDYETTLSASQIEASFDVETAVSEAYNIGRNGNIISNNYNILYTIIFGREIDCDLNYNDEELEEKINDISSKLPGTVVENSYYIEDENLIIVRGNEGLSIKKDELKEIIIEEIKDINNKYALIEIPTEIVEPAEIDLEQIRSEIYKEPQDAYVSTNEETGKTEVHTHVNGVDFAISMEEAEKIIAEDKEEYVIPLEITIPDKTLEDLGEEAFPDELATYTTRYDPTNTNRSNNLEISAEKINGTIIMPGETFSYNQTVGERTIEAGYKEAGAYAGGKVVQDVGGGICQTSSTLYNAVLLANLEIVERSNHQFLTSYVDAGRDATVAWGSIDFKFKNTRTYPIKIVATVKNGVCTMSIYGIEEETEYEVVIQSNVLSYISYTTQYENDSTLEEGKEEVEQSGYNGCTSEAYRILKLNGEVVSKTLLSKDTYNPMTRIIRRGTKKVEKEEETTSQDDTNDEESNTTEET